MADIDALIPNYRRAKDKWPDAPLLAKSYEEMTRCLDSGSHGLLEHIKSFIECVCVTVLSEFNQPLESSTPNSTELLVAALRCLGFHNSRGSNKLDKLLSAFNKLSDAMSEMRNETGPLAHGRDAFFDAVCADQARAFLHVGGAILSALMNAMEGKEPNLIVTREPYERFPHLNNKIDKSVAVQVNVDSNKRPPTIIIKIAPAQFQEAIEIRVEPSRLLYGVDRSIYVEMLKSIDEIETDESDDDLDDAVDLTLHGSRLP